MTRRKPKSNLPRHPLAGLNDNLRAFDQINEVNFEEDCVRYLLTQFDMAEARWELLRKHKLATGENRLTLPDFCLHFNSFPLSLNSLVVDVAKSDRLSVLYKDFAARPVFKKWKEMRSEQPEELKGLPFGLIVKWPFMPRGLVFHTLGDLGINGVRLHFREGRFQLYVEPLEQVTKWLKQHWSP